MNVTRQDALVAADLLKKSGNGSVASIGTIQGGRNSRTFEITTNSGTQFVLKSYAQTPMHHHNRQQAEIDFLEHCRSAGITRVPTILAWSTVAAASLFTKVPGRPFTVLGRDPVDDEIRQMADFIDNLNRNLKAPIGLQAAAEACFSIRDHLDTVEGRVQRVVGIKGSTDLHKGVVRWAQMSLVPTWRAVYEGVLKTCTPDELVQPLEQRQMCLSPSDFGFHNILVDEEKGIYFVDFEYAGFDDPAKLVCDSLLQPRISLSKSVRRRLRRALCDALQLDLNDQRRVDLLMNVYTIKWACIVLNSFAVHSSHSQGGSDLGAQGLGLDHQFSLAQALVQRVAEGRDSR